MSIKSLGPFFWSFLESFGVYIVRFFFTIAVANILEISDYGFVGISAFFITIASIFAEGGMVMSLVQRKNFDSINQSTVFWSNFVISIFIYLILFICSKEIALYYEREEVEDIIRVSALSIPLTALTVVHSAILLSNIDFKFLAFSKSGIALITGLATVYLALDGFGYWSLIIGSLLSNVLLLIFYMIYVRTKIKFSFNLGVFLNHYKYGVNLMFQGISSASFEQFLYPVLAKSSFGVLGLYSISDRFYQVFIRRTSIALTRVTFPKLVHISSDQFSSQFVKWLKIVVSASLLLVLLANLAVVVIYEYLLDSKWLESKNLTRVLLIDGALYPVLLYIQNALNASGNSKMSLIVDIVKKVTFLLLVLGLLKFGLEVALIGHFISSLISLVIGFIIVRTNLIGTFLTLEAFTYCLVFVGSLALMSLTDGVVSIVINLLGVLVMLYTLKHYRNPVLQIFRL